MICLSSNDRKLTFSRENASLQTLVFRGKTIPFSAAPLFTLGLHDHSRNLEILSSNEFLIQTETKENGLIFHASGYQKHPFMTVSVAIREEDGFFYFRPEVKNIPDEFLLEWIDVPQLSLPPGGKIFWPHTEGVLIDHPEEREKSRWSRYHVLGFLKLNEEGAYSEGGYYPGVCQMQFLSWQKENTVLYFGAHDRKHGTKAVEYVPLSDGGIRFSLQTFCGGCDRDYIADFDYVLGALPGDWMDACAVYRNWIKDDPALPSRGDLPKLVKESPVVMIYPVRGHGSDSGCMTEGNEYFPYRNAMPYVEKYAELFDCKILSLLMHWEGTAPWAPPYVWPPFGGTGMLEYYANRLHSKGHYLGVYCSGSAWTQQSCIVDYSREQECEDLGLRDQMIRGPHGEIDAVICNGKKAQRLGFDMCLAQEWPRRTLKEELLKLTTVGIDYAQFFDQNLGGAFHTCYALNHNHPPLPGRWQTSVMKSLLEEMTAELRAKNNPMVLGCEAASADIYMKELPFNDLRSCWNWGRGIPVPGYQFVFHEYVNNFMGNQCGSSGTFDDAASPENLLYRTGYAFSSGDLLSMVLKDSGKIHWGWGTLWEVEEPEQRDVITFIRNLNQMRKRYGKFLQYGRMEKPLLWLRGGEYALHFHGRTERVASWFHSAWEAQDGKRGEIITNFLPKKQILSWEAPCGYRLLVNGREFMDGTLALEPLNAICVELERRGK